MAKATYKAKARKFIKYDGKFINEGDKFEVKIADVEEMKKHADIEIPKGATPPPANPGEGQGDKKDDKKEGEKEGE